MADFESEIEKLPPDERLKRVRELEAEQRKKLEEELEEKRKELEELEEEGKKALEEVEELEDKTLDEITRERQEQINKLEAEIQEFREATDFLPESIDEAAEFQGYQSNPQEGYQNTSINEAVKNIEYLMSGNASESGAQRAERELYQNVRDLREQGGIDESYHIRKLHEQVLELNRKNPDDDYLRRTTFLFGFSQEEPSSNYQQ